MKPTEASLVGKVIDNWYQSIGSVDAVDVSQLNW